MAQGNKKHVTQNAREKKNRDNIKHKDKWNKKLMSLKYS